MSTIHKIGFPLEQWFDLSKRITRADRDVCEAQMALYAVKDGDDPEGARVRDAVCSMRRAVKLHNRKFA